MNNICIDLLVVIPRCIYLTKKSTKFLLFAYYTDAILKDTEMHNAPADTIDKICTCNWVCKYPQKWFSPLSSSVGWIMMQFANTVSMNQLGLHEHNNMNARGLQSTHLLQSPAPRWPTHPCVLRNRPKAIISIPVSVLQKWKGTKWQIIINNKQTLVFFGLYVNYLPIVA